MEVFGLRVTRVNGGAEETEQNPFTLPITGTDFVSISNRSFWEKIIRRTFNRTIYTDADNKITLAMLDSFDDSEANKGVINYIVDGIVNRSASVALKYDLPTGVVLRMSQLEIKEYNKAVVKPKNQIVLNFSGWDKSKISAMSFTLIYLLNQIRITQWGVAGSLVVKLNNAREKLQNNQSINAEVSSIINALKDSRGVALDGGDSVGGVDSLHTEVIKQASQDVYRDLAALIDLPYSLVTNEATTGASVIGDADANAESDALESYYWSIMVPVFTKLFGVTPAYRKEKWRSYESKARTAQLISMQDMLSDQTKSRMVAEIFEIDESETINGVENDNEVGSETGNQ